MHAKMDMRSALLRWSKPTSRLLTGQCETGISVPAGTTPAWEPRLPSVHKTGNLRILNPTRDIRRRCHTDLGAKTSMT
jgi:hypothetical protein